MLLGIQPALQTALLPAPQPVPLRSLSENDNWHATINWPRSAWESTFVWSLQNSRVRKCARQTVSEELQFPQVGKGTVAAPYTWYCACKGGPASGLCKLEQISC